MKNGRYTNASELIRMALREKRKIELHEVEQKIEVGLRSAARGDLLDGESVLEELKAESARRRKVL